MTRRGIAPSAGEKVALAAAISDLERCDYNALFSLAGIPLPQALPYFTVGSEWSLMRNQAAAWEAYAQQQELVCWVGIRHLIKRMRPVFLVALAANPGLATDFPGLDALFAAKAKAAKRASATKAANRAAVAEGEPAFHGGVGKIRAKRAAKAALVAERSVEAKGAKK